jgi:hypothetical protein
MQNLKTFFFIVICLFIILNSALASIPKDKCKRRDYSSRFGPLREQDGHGFCGLFSSTALIEELHCKGDPALCGKYISPLDASRCSWNLLTENESTSPYNALNCVIHSGGVCREEHAPYDAVQKLPCTLWRYLPGLNFSAKCNNQRLARLYKMWSNTTNTCPQGANSANVPAEVKEIRRGLIRALSELVPESVIMNKNLEALFFESKSESDFLRRILISEACENSRLPVPAKLNNFYLKTNEMDDKSRRKEILNFIVEGLANNSSVAIDYEIRRTGLVNSIYYLGGTDKHSVVVTGMRFNESKSRCEFQLRNSWGAGADFNGWYDANIIERSVYAANYLTPEDHPK